MRMIGKICLIILMIAFLVSSCTISSTKERYLANFERFIKNIEKDHSIYNQRDWRWAKRRYRLYSEEWYEKYEDKLTVQDKLKVEELKARYRVVLKSSRLFKNLENQIKDSIDSIKSEFDRYFDEDFDKDMKRATESVREIGDSTRKAIDAIIEDLGKK